MSASSEDRINPTLTVAQVQSLMKVATGQALAEGEVMDLCGALVALSGELLMLDGGPPDLWVVS